MMGLRKELRDMGVESKTINFLEYVCIVKNTNMVQFLANAAGVEKSKPKSKPKGFKKS